MRLLHLPLSALALSAPIWCSPALGRLWAAEQNREVSEPSVAAEAIWGDERRVFRMLVAAQPDGAEMAYKEGDIVNDSVALHVLPSSALPDTSPLSDLNLQFFVAHGN